MLKPLFSLMPDRLNNSRVIRHVVIVECHITGLASGDDQFTQACFHLTPDQGVLLQNGQTAQQGGYGALRSGGFVVTKENGQPFHIQQGAR